jgi:hypothetical protein
MSVVVQRGNGRGTAMKIETWLGGGESDQVRDDLFIAVEGGSQVVWGGWLAAMVQIQCFSFSLRWEVIGRRVAGR